MFDRKMREQLKEIEHKLEILETYLIVRDPGTAKSADAYDGLRKLLQRADKGTQIHLAHLAELDSLLELSDDTELARAKIGEFLDQIGLERLTSTDLPGAFEVSGGGEGPLEVDRPAYVVIETGQIVKRGAAHFVEIEAESSLDDGSETGEAEKGPIREVGPPLAEDDQDEEETR